MAVKKTREQWLQEAIAEMRPWFKALGHPLPRKVRVAVGFTSKGARSTRIGECWSKDASKDGTFEIFIVPSQDAPIRVLDILAHELCHAAVGLADGHGKLFGKVARGIGLEGKLTSTVGGKEFQKACRPILKKIGKMPHAALEGGQSSGPPKQSTRLIKAQCEACDYTIRVTAKWIEVSPPCCPDPDCPDHDTPMTLG